MVLGLSANQSELALKGGPSSSSRHISTDEARISSSSPTSRHSHIFKDDCPNISATNKTYPIMSPKTQPLIYAELLSNIRQISVIVALDAPCGPGTKAELSADGRQFMLHRDGDTSTLDLPGQAVLVQLQKPVLGNKELSWRIPIAGQATRASIEDAQSNEAPWSAKELSKDAEFACRNCATIILRKGTIKVWKDLPSENWAEMMEFWHCHKPDVPAEEANGSNGHGHVHHDQTAASKGYGASSKFIASKSTGLIDLTTFLLTSNDCTNIEVRQNPFPMLLISICRLVYSLEAYQWASRRWPLSASRFSDLVTDTNALD